MVGHYPATTRFGESGYSLYGAIGDGLRSLELAFQVLVDIQYDQPWRQTEGECQIIPSDPVRPVR